MKVAIIGGGFAGVRAAIGLANKSGFKVKLISKQPYFEYHAALYRSATGRSPLEVAIPLIDFFEYASNVEVVEDEITDLNHVKKAIRGKSESVYHYDALILALGNVTAYYGIKGLEEFSLGVKTIQEALHLKRHLHEQLLSGDSDKNYVVIGAGATGVELAAELTSYLKKIRRNHNARSNFTVDLVEAAPKAMANMDSDFSLAVEKRLRQLKVKPVFEAAVKSENREGVKLPGGNIHSHTVIWTAGVCNNPFFAKYPDLFKTGRMGRVQVDKFMRATDDIYVVGDSADTKYSGMAQTALHDAKFVSANLIKQLSGEKLSTYRSHKPVYAIPVGSRWAAVHWGPFKFYGRAGWAVRRLADLYLYLTFLPFTKALTVWRYGNTYEEICPKCE